MATVREFSRVGPCVTVGEIINETPCFYRVRQHDGTVRQVLKHSSVRHVHVEPCRSCRDHPQTQYPDGYMD